MAAADACVVCRRGEAPVCDRCRRRASEQLAALPELHERLRTALVPGSAGGERVSSTKGEAPMSARLAALTLIAGGSDDARCVFVPAVRIWTTTELVPLITPVGGVSEDREVRTWHREHVRDSGGRLVMALVDDQSGVLPVREWVRAWSLEWRRAFGHSADDRGPVRARRRNPAIVQPGHPDDPVAREWDERWPATGWGPVTHRQHAYLSTWLDEACTRVRTIGDFAASLRTLTGAAHAALGDIDDLEYVGRCPEQTQNDPAANPSACGATIWHDPYASVITCPRCHTETGQDHSVWLARRILDAWPIDRRRRYPRGLIEVLRMPGCATCSAPVRVQWIAATERADREPFWRPGDITCPAGCEAVA